MTEQAQKHRILKNKPLVEAIFELKWKLQEPQPDFKIDPYYKVLIGRIYDKINSEYPFIEQLPTASMPDDMAAYVVQLRFRKEKDKWPLVQLGPGIITLNDTDNYIWEDFEKRVNEAVEALFQTYPEAEKNLSISSVMLRYIDAVQFDYAQGKIFEFMKNQLKINIEVPKELFVDTGVSDSPRTFGCRLAYTSTKPQGILNLSFGRGKIKAGDALIWETMIQVGKENCPTSKEEIINWVKDAHNLVNNWFFKLIEGDLQKRFE